MTRAIVLLVVGFTLGFGWGCVEEPDEWNVEMVGCIDPASPDNRWDTCTELCKWDKARCFEDGCGGVTVREGHCTVEYSEPTALGCDDPLVGTGPFKCCCDYR